MLTRTIFLNNNYLLSTDTLASFEPRQLVAGCTDEIVLLHQNTTIETSYSCQIS